MLSITAQNSLSRHTLKYTLTSVLGCICNPLCHNGLSGLLSRLASFGNNRILSDRHRQLDSCRTDGDFDRQFSTRFAVQLVFPLAFPLAFYHQFLSHEALSTASPMHEPRQHVPRRRSEHVQQSVERADFGHVEEPAEHRHVCGDDFRPGYAGASGRVRADLFVLEHGKERCEHIVRHGTAVGASGTFRSANCSSGHSRRYAEHERFAFGHAQVHTDGLVFLQEASPAPRMLRQAQASCHGVGTASRDDAYCREFIAWRAAGGDCLNDRAQSAVASRGNKQVICADFGRIAANEIVKRHVLVAAEHFEEGVHAVIGNEAALLVVDYDPHTEFLLYDYCSIIFSEMRLLWNRRDSQSDAFVMRVFSARDNVFVLCPLHCFRVRAEPAAILRVDFVPRVFDFERAGRGKLRALGNVMRAYAETLHSLFAGEADVRFLRTIGKRGFSMQAEVPAFGMFVDLRFSDFRPRAVRRFGEFYCGRRAVVNFLRLSAFDNRVCIRPGHFARWSSKFVDKSPRLRRVLRKEARIGAWVEDKILNGMSAGGNRAFAFHHVLDDESTRGEAVLVAVMDGHAVRAFVSERGERMRRNHEPEGVFEACDASAFAGKLDMETGIVKAVYQCRIVNVAGDVAGLIRSPDLSAAACGFDDDRRGCAFRQNKARFEDCSAFGRKTLQRVRNSAEDVGRVKGENGFRGFAGADEALFVVGETFERACTDFDIAERGRKIGGIAEPAVAPLAARPEAFGRAFRAGFFRVLQPGLGVVIEDDPAAFVVEKANHFFAGAKAVIHRMDTFFKHRQVAWRDFVKFAEHFGQTVRKAVREGRVFLLIDERRIAIGVFARCDDVLFRRMLTVEVLDIGVEIVPGIIVEDFGAFVALDVGNARLETGDSGNHCEHVGVAVADCEAVDIENLKRVVNIFAGETLDGRKIVEDAEVVVDDEFPEGNGKFLAGFALEARRFNEGFEGGIIRNVFRHDAGRISHEALLLARRTNTREGSQRSGCVKTKRYDISLVDGNEYNQAGSSDGRSTVAIVFVTDIGNTSVSWGVFDGEKPVVTGHNRHSGAPSRAVAAVLGNAGGKDVEAIGISGVVPDIVNEVLEAARKETKLPVLRYRKDFKPGIEIGVDMPDAAGDDRVANTRAAYHLAKGGAIAVDVGTASTVDVVTKDGIFVGGAILPGIQMMLDALHKRTALLPQIKPNSPITAVGSDTQQAILSGVVLGLAGAVDTLVRNMRKEKKLEHCPVYLVGGDADLVNRYLVTAVQKVPHLTLLGVALDLIAAAE